ncbi:MAG: M56 family metallopeptidase [Acidobacteriota bacterium]
MESYWPLILTSAENFMLISTALSVALFGAAAIVRTSKRTRAWHPLRLSRVYAVALIAPPLASMWLVSASLLPVMWLAAERWVQEHRAAHTDHLLSALTVSLDPALSYAAISFASIALVVAAHAVAKGYFRIGRVVRRLEIDSEPAAPERIRQVEDACGRYGISIGLVVSRYPFSFVWGYFRSKLIVSTGLINALTSEELAALLEHEAAHHTRRDNLSKWMLIICRYLSPAFPLTGLLYRWWSEQVEMVCDEVAARRTNDPVEVAGALVRLTRLTLGMPRSSQLTESNFFGEHQAILERRVERVLSLSGLQTIEPVVMSRSWVKATTLCCAAFLLTLATVFAVSPLAIHRLLELILHVF